MGRDDPAGRRGDGCGPIWAAAEFPLPQRPATESGVYRGAVTEAAVAGVLAALTRYERGGFGPDALDNGARCQGTLRPAMKQADRAIDWFSDPTARIVRRIRAADSSPGVLDATLFGEEIYLYGAHEEDRLRGAPGQLIASARERSASAQWTARSGQPHEGEEPRPVCRHQAPLHRCWARGSFAFPNVRLGRPTPATIGPCGHRVFGTNRRRLSRLRLLQRCDEHPPVPPLRDAFRRACAAETKSSCCLGAVTTSRTASSQHDSGGPNPAARVGANINAIDDLALDLLETRSKLVVSGSAAMPERAAP